VATSEEVAPNPTTATPPFSFGLDDARWEEDGDCERGLLVPRRRRERREVLEPLRTQLPASIGGPAASIAEGVVGSGAR
jgi:hypothetical protein